LKRWPVALALAFVALAAWWLMRPPGAPPHGVAQADRGRPLPASAPWLRPMGPVSDRSAGSGAGGGGHARGASPLEQIAPPVFRLKPDGHLLLDAQTRTDIERVAALHGRDEALASLDEATGALGEAARREARALYEQHVQYERALATALANQPDQPTLADARQQLQLLKDLRAQYFGEQAADLYGAEEGLQQRLLDDAEAAMASQGMTLEQAIGLAQEKLAREAAAGSPRR